MPTSRLRLTRRRRSQEVGGLTVATNDGRSNGTFSFGQKGRVRFQNLSTPFAESEMGPKPKAYVPNPQHVRNRLRGLLEEMRFSADYRTSRAPRYSVLSCEGAVVQTLAPVAQLNHGRASPVNRK